MPINQTNINFIQDGESSSAEVLNRPTRNLIDEVDAAIADGASVQATVQIDEGDTLQENIANEFVASVNAVFPAASSVDAGAYFEIFIAEVNYSVTPTITTDGTDTIVGRDGETTDSISFTGNFSGRIVLISNGLNQWRLLVGSLGGTSNNIYIPPDTVGGGAAGTGVWTVLPDGSNLAGGLSFIPDNGTTACSYNLPTTPSDGDTFAFVASETLFSVNTMTFVVTDKNINGDATSLVVDVDGFCGFVVYRAALNEWRIYQDGTIGIGA